MTQLTELFSPIYLTSPIIYKTGTCREFYRLVDQSATTLSTSYYIWESRRYAQIIVVPNFAVMITVIVN